MSDNERKQDVSENTPERKTPLALRHIILACVGAAIALCFAALIVWICVGARVEKEHSVKPDSAPVAGTQTVAAGAGAVFRDGRCTVELPVLKRDGQDDVKPVIKLVEVKAGKFTMSEFPVCRDGSETREIPHEVALKNDFYIGESEVTQAQWKALMGVKDNGAEKGKAKKSYYSFADGDVYPHGSDDMPVEMVSWDEAMKFCETLNKGGFAPDGWMFTLPTETQWEFAARGGIMSRGYKYSGGNDLAEVAWCKSNNGRVEPGTVVDKASLAGRGKNRPVKQKKPNELGLYDMTGNVWEWCSDDWSIDSRKVGELPVANRSSLRVIRGGCWYTEDKNCLVTVRSPMSWKSSAPYLGFRLALVRKGADIPKNAD